MLAKEGLAGADVILADLGVSSMQLDNPDRGFTYKESGPLDMRMNPARGEPASQLLAHLSEDKLARLLEENADEPDARAIARALKAQAIDTTGELPLRAAAVPPSAPGRPTRTWRRRSAGRSRRCASP